MKALQVPSTQRLADLSLSDIQPPASPGRGEVKLRMKAVSLNHRDLFVATGYEVWQAPAGRILASDGVGIVAAIGPGVERLAPGQRVMTTILPRWISGPMTIEKRGGGLGGPGRDGVLAEEVVLPAESLVPVPDVFSDVEAAAFPAAGVTAWHTVTRAGSLRPGASVLVQGTGGVALFAIQLLVAAGARVIATSSADWKLARLRELGVAECINYRKNPDWDAEVLRLTDGQGVDHVIDIGGGSGSLLRSMSAIAVEGIVSMVGMIGGMRPEIDIGMVFQKNLRMDGVETGSRAMLEDMLAYCADRRIHPVIDQAFPLDSVREAFLHLERAEHIGKICIQF